MEFKMSDKIDIFEELTLPLIPLRGLVGFPAVQLNIEIVRPISLKAFTAAVFGGIGSIPGAFLGGILHIVDLFLTKVPSGVNVSELSKHILEIDGVEDVHHVHVWSMDGQNNYATLHVVVDERHVVLDYRCYKLVVRILKYHTNVFTKFVIKFIKLATSFFFVSKYFNNLLTVHCFFNKTFAST